MSFLRPLESLARMLQCLLGMFVSGLVIFFPVVRGRGAVRVRGELVEFGSSLVRFIWHNVSRPGCLVHLKTILFFKLSNNEQSRRGDALLAERRMRANGGRSENKWDRHHWREKKGTKHCLPSLCWCVS